MTDANTGVETEVTIPEALLVTLDGDYPQNYLPTYQPTKQPNCLLLVSRLPHKGGVVVELIGLRTRRHRPGRSGAHSGLHLQPQKRAQR